MFFWSLQLALGNDVQDTIAKNWDITDPAKWKASEQIDSELGTLNGVTLSLIKPWVEVPINNPGSILVYTDFNTQHELAKYKHARWYSHDSAYNSAQWCIQHYNAVKDTTWPDASTLEELLALPQVVLDELVLDFDFDLDKIREECLGKTREIRTAELNGLTVDGPARRFAKNTSYQFLLQDVVRSKFKCVTDALGLDHTKEVEEHVDNWLAMHPPLIREMLVKDFGKIEG